MAVGVTPADPTPNDNPGKAFGLLGAKMDGAAEEQEGHNRHSYPPSALFHGSWGIGGWPALKASLKRDATLMKRMATFWVFKSLQVRAIACA